MHAFSFIEPRQPNEAVAAVARPGSRFIAGGTDLMQLMKDNVEAPDHLVDLEPLALQGITADSGSVTIGAMSRMSDVAVHPLISRDFPVISEALLASASPQIRNMATIGGNLLQRTRCGYFRDLGFPCNKRSPGSGCPAIHGENRTLAILGGSKHCIATHASDLAVALVALDTSVTLLGPHGQRELPLREFHRLPSETPHIETALEPGELITSIAIPSTAVARRSTYIKVRDRASFEFALVSAAVGLDIDRGQIRDARVAMGGIGTKPWRLDAVETALRGAPASDSTFASAVERAIEGAQPATQNGFKVKLMQRTLARALQIVAA